MPHQRRIADVATEYDPETGIPYYRKSTTTVPRQSGKTMLDMACALDTLISSTTPKRSVYTAQTGKDARRKFLEEIVPMLRTSRGLWGSRRSKDPRGDGLITNVRRRAGEEGLDFMNGSLFLVDSSSETAGHGGTIHRATLDEIWADRDRRRLVGLSPSMSTVREAQLWLWSTAGSARSLLFNSEQKAGRAAVEAGLDREVCYFEWSAERGADIDDEELWWATMPALGYTQAIEVIRAERRNFDDPEDQEGPDGFRRAYLNIPTIGQVSEIPMDKWDDVSSDTAAPAGELTLALDCTVGRDHASLVVADPDGALELIHDADGTSWCVEKTAEQAAKLKAPVFIDGGGPAAVFVDELEAKGATVVTLSTAEFISACGGMYDAIVNRTIQIRRHQAADDAAHAASKRSIGDRWAWARKVGAYNATPLVAMSIALWGTNHRPAGKAREPNIW
jgi:phage terminase large subunit-like protein